MLPKFPTELVEYKLSIISTQVRTSTELKQVFYRQREDPEAMKSLFIQLDTKINDIVHELNRAMT